MYWVCAKPLSGSAVIECTTEPTVQPFPSCQLHLHVFACIIVHSSENSQFWHLCSDGFSSVSNVDKGAKLQQSGLYYIIVLQEKWESVSEKEKKNGAYNNIYIYYEI